MNFPWSELGQVLVVGLLAGAGVVALFAAGVRLLAGPEGGTARTVPAYACFALCGAAVLYGLYTLLPL
ncbi:hypothetical protein ACTMTJ_32640 [Phytohabitans sp. LJ34]|uniref:hypothetical protein n=1 Tax=Phytohabitans sp. LJ34 TaxID=3452217 RepID=UPI003F8C07FA